MNISIHHKMGCANSKKIAEQAKRDRIDKYNEVNRMRNDIFEYEKDIRYKEIAIKRYQIFVKFGIYPMLYRCYYDTDFDLEESVVKLRIEQNINSINVRTEKINKLLDKIRCLNIDNISEENEISSKPYNNNTIYYFEYKNFDPSKLKGMSGSFLRDLALINLDYME